MRVYILIGFLLVLGTNNAQGQNKSIKKFPCKTLRQTDSLTVNVSGLMDHNDLQINWIKEEIKSDGISTWFTRWIKDSNLDNESEYFSNMSRDMELSLQPGDRIFYYSTPDNYWSSFAGQEGILIIRDCIIVGKYILMQS
ncbi:MAG: hypothetical protein KF845_00240 [Cyclobacteriaceae bacterium]|nr:hypothetical protein [Cyclobacteriaceae bacterium]